MDSGVEPKAKSTTYLNARNKIPAGYAFLQGGKNIINEQAALTHANKANDHCTCELSTQVNVKSGESLGFKDLQFGNVSPRAIDIYMNAKKLRLQVLLDRNEGDVVADAIVKGDGIFGIELIEPVIGERTIYLKFTAVTLDETECDIAKVDSIRFLDEYDL